MPATAPLVLIATCDPATRTFLSPALAQHGANVTHADHEDQAYAKALELMPAAVIADLGADGINALALRDRLRHDERTRHIPILSVRGSAETWLRAVRLVTMLLLTSNPDALRRSIDVVMSTSPAIPTC